MEKLKNIQEMSALLGKLEAEDFETFTKALFMHVRGIEDEETLDQMFETYNSHDISLLNDLIMQETE